MQANSYDLSLSLEDAVNKWLARSTGRARLAASDHVPQEGGGTAAGGRTVAGGGRARWMAGQERCRSWEEGARRYCALQLCAKIEVPRHRSLAPCSHASQPCAAWPTSVWRRPDQAMPVPRPGVRLGHCGEIDRASTWRWIKPRPLVAVFGFASNASQQRFRGQPPPHRGGAERSVGHAAPVASKPWSGCQLCWPVGHQSMTTGLRRAHRRDRCLHD